MTHRGGVEEVGQGDDGKGFEGAMTYRGGVEEVGQGDDDKGFECAELAAQVVPPALSLTCAKVLFLLLVPPTLLLDILPPRRPTGAQLTRWAQLAQLQAAWGSRVRG